MQRMREVIRGSLARSLRQCAAEDRLAASLPIVCGGPLASHCEVLHLDDSGALHLRVDPGAWLPPLLSMGDLLRHDLARVSGVALRKVHFKEAGRGDPASRVDRPGEVLP